MIFVFRIMKYDGFGHLVVVAEKEVDLAGFEFSDPNNINFGVKSIAGNAGKTENTIVLEIGPVVKK